MDQLILPQLNKAHVQNGDVDSIKDEALVQAFLKNNPSVEFIEFRFVDFCGVVRCKVITVSHALRIARVKGEGVHCFANTLNLGGALDQLNTEFLFAGEDIIMPDWSSLVPCHYAPQRAAVNCFIMEAETGDKRCLRTLLKRFLHTAAESSTNPTNFLMGFEIEFYLTPSNEAEAPVSTPPSIFTLATIRDSHFSIVEEVVRILEKAGFGVWGFHAEGGPGFYEISLSPLPPLQAADALIYAQEAIRSVAAAKGLHATMHPQPFEKLATCGLHAHLSLSSPDGKPQKQEVADSFLAGLIQSTPALCAVCMPSYDSYSRSFYRFNRQWISWGRQHRGCTYREIKRAHWEIRKIDAMTNIYLAIIALLGVGFAAVERKEQLVMKPLKSFSIECKIEEAERQELGITQMLPETLHEALQSLSKDEAVQQALGPEVFERYLAVKKIENEKFAQMTRRERVLACMRNF